MRKRLSAFYLLALLGATTIGAEQGLSQATYDSLSRIHKLIDAGKNREALAKLRALKPSKAANAAYESAMIQQTLGFVYSRLGEHKQAAQAFKRALQQNALPSDVVHRLHYDLAQVLIAANALEEGLDYLQRWLNKESAPDLASTELAASAYYRAERWKEAIPHVKKLIAQGVKPEEQWRQVLLSCYYGSAQYAEAAGLLEQMVARHPNEPGSWMQLVALYQRAGKDRRALAVLDLAYKQGLLDAQGIVQLAQTMSYLGMPYQAAQLLEAELKAGAIKRGPAALELLANAWLLAREKGKAAAVFEQLARATGSGDVYFALGQLRFSMEQWDEAIRAVDSALSTGFAKTGAARLLQGIALYHTGEYDRSLQTLERLSQDPANRNEALWWIKRIQRERTNAS